MIVGYEYGHILEYPKTGETVESLMYLGLTGTKHTRIGDGVYSKHLRDVGFLDGFNP